MALLPIVASVSEIATALPSCLAEHPAPSSKHCEQLLTGVVTLSDAVCQALVIVAVRCGRIILHAGHIERLRNELLGAWLLSGDFEASGVDAGLASARAKLTSVVGSKSTPLSCLWRTMLRLVIRQIPAGTRCLADDFERHLAQLSQNCLQIKPSEVPGIIGFATELRNRCEADAGMIREAMRGLNDLPRRSVGLRVATVAATSVPSRRRTRASAA